jgi:integrase
LGLRQGETLGLRWKDIDFDGGTVKVSGSLQRVPTSVREPGAPRLMLKDTKTESSRRTQILPPLVTASLREHRHRHLEERVAAGSAWQDNDLVFGTTSTGVISVT